MNFLSLFLGLSLISFYSVMASSRHCKGKRVKTVAEQIASLNPQTDLNVIDLNIFNNGSFASGYDYVVEPAYTKGLYARKDNWLIEVKALPGQTINLEKDWDLNLSGGSKNSMEASFIRFIKDPCEAMLANPYPPNRIPLKSSIALGSKFLIGDYFLFRASSGLVLSSEIVGLLGTPLWGVTLGGAYAMEGFYQIHIVRLDDDHIRFKIVGHRGRNFKASLGIGYKEKFEVFRIKALDNQLERFVNTKPVTLSAHKGNSKVFMIDYVLNLRDEKVSNAFEQALKKTNDFKNLDLTAPFKKQTNLEDSLLLDLTPLEDLYKTDYAQNNVKRIRRNIKTTSEQDSYGIGLDLGNKVFGLKLSGGGATSKMDITNPGEIVERYLLRTWEKSWESRFLYSYTRNRSEDSLSALFISDENYHKLTPLNVVREMSQRKNRFSFRDFQKLKIKLKKSLPMIVYKEIPFGDWKQDPSVKYFNFGFRYKLLMSPESILNAPELRAEEIRTRFKAYVAEKNLGSEDFFSSAGRDPTIYTPAHEFESSLFSLSSRLEKALNKDLPMRERLEEITKLKLNTLFAESGIGFIMSLHPNHMKELFHFELDISSNEAMIDFSFGLSQNIELYKKILTIKAALDDDALDLLRDAELLSLKKER
jgi:hypothetical protein